MQQQHRGRLADDIAAAHYDRVLAADWDSAALEDLYYSCRSAGHERRTASLQASGIYGMKAIHVLFRHHGIEKQFCIDMSGQRELDKNAVDVVAGVQIGDQRQHLLGCDRLRRLDHFAEKAQLAACLDFTADVNLRSRHMAYQHRRQTGPDAPCSKQSNLFGDFRLDLRGDGRTIQNPAHAITNLSLILQTRRSADQRNLSSLAQPNHNPRGETFQRNECIRSCFAVQLNGLLGDLAAGFGAAGRQAQLHQ